MPLEKNITQLNLLSNQRKGQLSILDVKILSYIIIIVLYCILYCILSSIKHVLSGQ